MTGPECAGCPDLVRREDDFTRDDYGRFWHVDCWEAALTGTTYFGKVVPVIVYSPDGRHHP